MRGSLTDVVTLGRVMSAKVINAPLGDSMNYNGEQGEKSADVEDNTHATKTKKEFR